MSKNSLYLMIFINRANLLHQYYFNNKDFEIPIFIRNFVLRNIMNPKNQVNYDN